MLAGQLAGGAANPLSSSSTGCSNTSSAASASLTRSLPPLAELVKVVELDEGVYQREYKNGLVYLFGNGPWVGCVPPPVPKPEQYYFKVGSTLCS